VIPPPTGSSSIGAPVGDDMVVRSGSWVRKLVAGLVGAGAAVALATWWMSSRGSAKHDVAAEPAAHTSLAAVPTPELPTTPPPPSPPEHAEPIAPAAAPTPVAAAPSKPPVMAETSAVRPKTPPPSPRSGRRPVAAATDDIDERAADPKLARALPTEFPQLLAACRTAFVDKRMPDAEVACVAAQDANPDSAEANALLAHALFNRNRRREALGWAERAIAINPKLADAYVIVGGVHQAEGEMTAAKAAYQKYLQLAPTGQYAGDLRAIVDGQK
jgi:hypothetical protein